MPTVTRWPRMHGLPPITAGAWVMRGNGFMTGNLSPNHITLCNCDRSKDASADAVRGCLRAPGPRIARSRNPGYAPVAQLEIEVAGIDEHAKALAEDENRIADEKSVAEQQHAAADREEPERDRHHHLAGALGGDPLHHEA